MRRERQPLGRSDRMVRHQRSARMRWERREERMRRPKNSHTGLWIGLSAVFLAGIIVCGGLLLTVRQGEAAPFTFLGGQIVLRDPQQVRGFAEMRSEVRSLEAARVTRASAAYASGAEGAELFAGNAAGGGSSADLLNDAQNWPLVARYQGCLGPGVIIDGLDVSGLTPAAAAEALARIPAEGGGEFSVTVLCSGERYTIDSSRIPMTRNIDEVVQDALEYTWADMPAADLSGSGTEAQVKQNLDETPFEARLRALRKSEQERAGRLDATEARLAAMADTPLHFSTEWTFDRSSIRTLTDEIAQAGSSQPVNASIADFNPDTKTFAVLPETNGVRVDPELLHDDVMACLDRGDLYGTVTARSETVWAEESAATLARKLGRISSYSTRTTSNANRNTNVRLSAEAICGHRVDPGVNFSFNTVVGQRTERKGYRPATAISGGQNIEEIGGGVCQTSSTLFNAVARGNFEILHRSPHAWPSSYVEKGMDATVDWPNLDFVWRNNTDYPVFIWARYENRTVTVELYGVTLGEGISIDLESVVTETLPIPEGIANVRNESLAPGTRQLKVKARRGYVVETWQVWKHDGYEYSRNLLCTSRYRAYQETWEYN